MQYLQLFLLELYHLAYQMSPYLLLGFFIAGLLKVYMPSEMLNKYLGKNNFRSVLNGTLFGIPLPLCSCGVIPTGVSLYKNGASKGATQSFFISTPQTGVDSVMVTWSLLGLPFAIIRPFIAFVTGILGGVFSNLFDKGQYQKHMEPVDLFLEGKRTKNRIKEMFRYAFVDFVDDIAKWLLIGLLLAALISILVPDGFFAEHLSNTWLSMLFMLAISLPVYACSTGSVPLAAVLLMKGINPGAILVFLMAGPATNVATMTVIANTIGKKFLVIYLLTIISGALAFGYLVDTLLPASWFVITEQMHTQVHFLPDWVYLSSVIFISFLLTLSLIRKYIFHKNMKVEDANAREARIILVAGMTCKNCKAKVESSLSSVKGVERVQVNLDKQRVMIVGDVDMKTIQQEIESLGYIFKGEVLS